MIKVVHGISLSVSSSETGDLHIPL